MRNRNQPLSRIDRRTCCLVAIVLVLGWLCLPGRVALGQADMLAPIKFDWPMLASPEIKKPPVKLAYSPRLVPLWIEALQQSEAGAQRHAAQAIYRASFYGVSGLEKAVPHLQAILAKNKGSRTARIAAAHTLVRLDARESAALFTKVAAEGDIELCLLIEPALAAWKYEPVEALWQQRLQGPLTNEGLVVLAIRQLAAAKVNEVAPRLQEIALNRRARIAYRVEAAKALAAIGKTPVRKAAESLLQYDKGPLVDRLVAGWLLQVNQPLEDSPEVEQLLAQLTKLSEDPQNVIVRLALQSLLQISPQTIRNGKTKWGQSSDARIRQLVWQALTRTVKPQAGDLRELVVGLNDPELDVRRTVAAGLGELAQQSEMKEMLVDLLVKELGRGDKFWRSQEQSMLLLVDWNHGAAAPQMAGLLNAEEAEAFATAAWGLRKLKAVEQLPAMHRRVIELVELLEEKVPENDSVDDVNEQLAQLLQAIGEMKYKEALPTLKRAAQKNGIAFTVRSAAVWAVGIIQAGQSDSEFVKFCYQRILDENMFDPEGAIVKQTCAIALGQMKSAEAVEFLQGQHDRLENISVFKWACSWSLNQINGHPILDFDPIVIAPGVWFLDVVETEESGN